MRIKKILLDFITDYLDKVKPNKFLFIRGDTYEIKNIQDLYSIEVNWTFGDCINRLKEIKENFYLIINFQPIIGLNSVIEASKLLNSNGFGFFITTPKFFIENESFIKTLRENGLNIKAAIYLQKGCYTSSNQSSKLLLVIRRGNSEELFVGELMDDVEPREQLLKNLKSFTEDKTPQLGTIINVNDFRKFSHLMFSKKLSNELKSVNRVKLSDISLEIIDCKNLIQNHQSKNENINNIFIPISNDLPVVRNYNEIKEKQQFYFKIIMDSEKAIDSFLYYLLNSSLGRKIRNWWHDGFGVELDKEYLLNCEIFILSIEEQIKFIEIQSRINNLSMYLESFNYELWNLKNDYSAIEKSLENLSFKNSLESWIESLPYPLATILWTYYSLSNIDENIGEKLEHLLNFFEAFTEFLVTIMLSSFAKDLEFFVKECRNLKKPYEKYFQKPTFDTWINIAEWLSKSLRRLENEKEKWGILVGLFGNPDEEFLEILMKKSLFKLLKSVREYRNIWKGHTGIKPHPTILRKNLSLLEDSLTRLREDIGDCLSKFLIVKPINMKVKQGVYHIRVDKLIGTRFPFQEIEIETRSPMEEENLYILHENYKPTIKMLPFIILKEDKTCYFFNRLEGEDARYISYHYDQKPEIHFKKDLVEFSLNLLERNLI